METTDKAFWCCSTVPTEQQLELENKCENILFHPAPKTVCAVWPISRFFWKSPRPSIGKTMGKRPE